VIPTLRNPQHVLVLGSANTETMNQPDTISWCIDRKAQRLERLFDGAAQALM
jgi:hypothetical protein